MKSVICFVILMIIISLLWGWLAMLPAQPTYVEHVRYGSSYNDSFDRDKCELNCRTTYGFRSLGLDRSLYYGCLSSCRDKAWQKFLGDRNGKK